MKLVIGLGNPGKQYKKTRHNTGFRVVEEFGKKHGFEESALGPKHKAMTAEGEINGEKVILVKPQTFMNLSGETVASLVKFFRLDPSRDILVCYDDKDILFGKLRERDEGSFGGHKGIKSIIDSLGTKIFPRLKFGVGHNIQTIATEDFVLRKFTSEEEEQLPRPINEAVKKIEDWLEKSEIW